MEAAEARDRIAVREQIEAIEQIRADELDPLVGMEPGAFLAGLRPAFDDDDRGGAALEQQVGEDPRAAAQIDHAPAGRAPDLTQHEPVAPAEVTAEQARAAAPLGARQPVRAGPAPGRDWAGLARILRRRSCMT